MELDVAPLRIVRADEDRLGEPVNRRESRRRRGGDEKAIGTEEHLSRRILRGDDVVRPLGLLPVEEDTPVRAERAGDVGQCGLHPGTLLASFAAAAQERYRHAGRIMDQ